MDHMIDDNDRLKPCPFCGSEAEFSSIDNADHPDDGGHFVYCTNNACGASSALIFPLMDNVEDMLLERWNRRSKIDQNDIYEKEQLRRLKAFVNEIFDDDGEVIVAGPNELEKGAVSHGLISIINVGILKKADWLRDDEPKN